MIVIYCLYREGVGGTCACITASRLAKADPSLKILVSYTLSFLRRIVKKGYSIDTNPRS